MLGWFSLRLKRDLDFMRRRLSKGKHYYFSQRSSDLLSKCECIISARNFENHSLNFTSLLHFNILLNGKFDCNCVVPEVLTVKSLYCSVIFLNAVFNFIEFPQSVKSYRNRRAPRLNAVKYNMLDSRCEF